MAKIKITDSTFWTMERLKELERLSKNHSVKYLEKHFGKPPEEIQQSMQYFRMHKKLKISSKVKRGKRITYYKPADAEGVLNGRFHDSEWAIM